MQSIGAPMKVAHQRRRILLLDSGLLQHCKLSGKENVFDARVSGCSRRAVCCSCVHAGLEEGLLCSTFETSLPVNTQGCFSPALFL